MASCLQTTPTPLGHCKMLLIQQWVTCLLNEQVGCPGPTWQLCPNVAYARQQTLSWNWWEIQSSLITRCLQVCAMTHTLLWQSKDHGNESSSIWNLQTLFCTTSMLVFQYRIPQNSCFWEDCLQYPRWLSIDQALSWQGSLACTLPYCSLNWPCKENSCANAIP